MRFVIGLFVVLVWPLSVAAQAVLLEPPEFPLDPPGPAADHPATDCFLLASGSIEPGDVDWVQVVIPFDSLQTVVDVDITSAGGNSLLMAWEVGGGVFFNINDMNSAIDDFCGFGDSTDPVGSPFDSAVNLQDTPAGTTIDIGVTGYADFGFVGNHAHTFDYEVWVFAWGEETGCLDDVECDDGVDCTSDTCDLPSGECAHTPDDGLCHNGLFCDGTETCDPVEGCLSGDRPCRDHEMCDEVIGCYDGAGPALDIRPGGCPNFVNRRGTGYLQMALLGTSEFDINDIDLTTLVLSRGDGQGGSVRPPAGRWGPRAAFADFGAPFENGRCQCAVALPDGIEDVMIRFRIPQVVAALGLEDIDSRDPVELRISGTTVDGVNFIATDCVRLIDFGHFLPRKEFR